MFHWLRLVWSAGGSGRVGTCGGRHGQSWHCEEDLTLPVLPVRWGWGGEGGEGRRGESEGVMGRDGSHVDNT